jgi:phospholysine phosphohistidine inorganic pyrophosphate phosphatase
MTTLQALLIDLDGVIYQDERPIAGAAATLAWVRQRSIPHVFLTNTTSCSRLDLVAKLARFGVPVTREQIVTPAVAAAEWLRAHAPGAAALFVPEATRADFDGVAALESDAEAGASSVVLGDLGAGWNFQSLNRAFRLLMDNSAAPLIALGMTRYWRAADGLRLDVGPFVAALELATSRRSVVIGKPSPAFFRAALSALNVPAVEALMIGDDVVADVGGARQAGMRALLVRTGKFREADLDSGPGADAVLGSIADLPGWWGRHGVGSRASQANI